MAYLRPEHGFFSVENIKGLLDTIELRLGSETGVERVPFSANAAFNDAVYAAARDYPHLLLTSNPAEGIRGLNDVVVRRAVAAMTDDEAAGQYVTGNVLYNQTRRGGRGDDDVQDPVRQGAAVVLAGNVEKQRSARFRATQREAQETYMAVPTDERFFGTRPKAHLDSQFRELR